MKKLINSIQLFYKRLFLSVLGLLTGRKYYFQIKPLETFTIKDSLGDAGFMKRFNHKSICLHSQEATYEKSREYYISDDEIVIKTC